MLRKHEGREERAHTFDEVWKSLDASDAQQLTTKAGTAFVAKAAITTKGKRSGERVIRYLQNGQDYGRCYPCCWEHYYNCNGTRIGMYSRAVDQGVDAGLPTSKLTRRDLLTMIERNNGPEGLDLAGRDLREIDLSSDAIQTEMERLGFPYLDPPPWYSEATRGVNLCGAILRQADLQRAYLWRGNYRGADMGGAILIRADLGGSILAGANLAEADLRMAHMHRVDLADADLTSANLSNVSLHEVDLSVARALTGAFLRGASLTDTTVLRDQLRSGVGEEQDRDFQGAHEAYLALKNAFESAGRYDDAGWAYIKERTMEKMTHHPLRARRYYAELENVSREINCRFRQWWSFYFRHTLTWIGDWLVELVCGYGESTVRVLSTLVAVYVVFTLGYGVTWSIIRVSVGPEGMTRSLTASPVDWAIFSLGALTTMDPAGLEPRSNLVQLFAGLEALLGIFLTGLLGFVVANRIRRS
jgi:uncharacterized protein YjbI with pentapeptide repeats